jgi:hypothetical protein
MIQKTTAVFITLGALFFVLIIIGFLQLEWRFSKSRAFFKTVANLPRNELANYSSRCGDLYTDRYTNGPIVITNNEILGQFDLAGKSPQFIYMNHGVVLVEYVIADVGTDIQWMDFSPNEPTWKLEGHSPAGGLVIFDPRQNK